MYIHNYIEQGRLWMEYGAPTYEEGKLSEAQKIIEQNLIALKQRDDFKRKVKELKKRQIYRL